MNGKQIFEPMWRCHGVIGEVDDVFALNDMTGDAPAEVIVDVVFQIDFLLVRQAVKIRPRFIRRPIVDRNEFDVATRKIRVPEKALDGTTRELHFVVGRDYNRYAIFEPRSARSLARCLEGRKCL